jgi:hypothetical protein
LDQITLDLGQTQLANVSDLISSVPIATRGEIWLRVHGDSAADYSLTIVRNSGFGLENNVDIASAQALGPEYKSRRAMLGHLNGSADPSDFYVFEASGPVDLRTIAPSGSSTVDWLDPLLRVYDSEGNLIVADDNSGGGANAAIRLDVAPGEVQRFYVEVTTADPSGTSAVGEYLLSVRGAAPADSLSLPASPVDGGDELAAAVDLLLAEEIDWSASDPT